MSKYDDIEINLNWTLKHCPFCGSLNCMTHKANNGFAVYCLDCLTIGPGDCKSEIDSVVAWNRRSLSVKLSEG